MKRRTKKEILTRTAKEQSECWNLRFIDESYLLDRDLFLIASLSQAAQDNERVDSETVQGIGLKIQKYLERRNLLEHFFFKRSLEFLMSPEQHKIELLKLKLIYRRSAGGSR